jgi:serine/threonine-protein kinase HipA
VHVDALVALASQILTHRSNWRTSLGGGKTGAALREILRVGTSAGGARAKAVIAWNRSTNEVRSGQVKAGDGFEYWLLKFDGVSGNRDKDLDDPRGFGALEFAYSRMATAAGIRMSECHLLEENGRRHFMTRRFDRAPDGGKLHMQSLAALGHLDYNAPGAHGYEEALLIIRQLGLSMDAIEEQFRRMVFNVVARNQDDHVKNIAFLMDASSRWSLAPAFDLTYSYNPTGPWTAQHQMTVNGKQDGFTLADFRAVAEVAAMKRGRADTIVHEVVSAVARWEEFAAAAAVAPAMREGVLDNLRLKIPTT